MTNKIDTVLKAITDRIAGVLPSDTVKTPKLSPSSVLSARSYIAKEQQCSTHIHSSINAIIIHSKQQSDSHDDKPVESEEGEKDSSENTNTNPSASLDPSVSFITKKIVKKNDDSRKEEPKAGGLEVEYFDTFPTRRNFTYVTDFMIIENISSIIDPRLLQVVLGKPYVDISNMTHDPPEGVMRFTNRTDEIAYKIPHKIEQYNSLSDLEKEHMKLVYLRNEEDKRRGVKYIMSKILRFYKECLELGPEYVTGINDEGEVM
ncbi:hypothetical protein Tco_1232768 [Tanacetum coccineum]